MLAYINVRVVQQGMSVQGAAGAGVVIAVLLVYC